MISYMHVYTYTYTYIMPCSKPFLRGGATRGPEAEDDLSDVSQDDDDLIQHDNVSQVAIKILQCMFKMTI